MNFLEKAFYAERDFATSHHLPSISEKDIAMEVKNLYSYPNLPIVPNPVLEWGNPRPLIDSQHLSLFGVDLIIDYEKPLRGSMRFNRGCTIMSFFHQMAHYHLDSDSHGIIYARKVLEIVPPDWLDSLMESYIYYGNLNEKHRDTIQGRSI